MSQFSDSDTTEADAAADADAKDVKEEVNEKSKAAANASEKKSTASPIPAHIAARSRRSPSAKLGQAYIAEYKQFFAQADLPDLPLDEFYKALETSPDIDFINWVAGKDADLGGQVLDKIYEQTGIPIFPVRHRMVSSGVLNRIIPILSTGNYPAQRMLDDTPAIPMGFMGPLMVMGHFNPFHNYTELFPKDMILPVWLPGNDYAQMRTKLRSQMNVFLKGLDTEEFRDQPEGYMTFKEYQEANPKTEPWLQAVRWAMKLDTARNDELVLSEISSNPEPDRSQLPEEYQLFVEHLEGGSVLPCENLLLNFSLIKDVPKNLWEKHTVSPICFSGRNLYVACKDASNFNFDDDITGHLDCRKIIKFRVPPSQILKRFSASSQRGVEVDDKKAVSRHVVDEKTTFEIAANEFQHYDPRTDEDRNRILRYVFNLCVNQNASDLHIDISEGFLRFRLAIDGAAVPMLNLSAEKADGIASVLKQWSGIKLDGYDDGEGRFDFSAYGRNFDCRVMLLYDHQKKPKFTIRVHDKTLGVKSLHELGLSIADVRRLRECYTKPHGIIIISGPTGSGKTTTLNSMIKELNLPSRVIYTLEDPVEYGIEGVCQKHASSDPRKIEMGVPSFAQMIPRLMRGDPDVILIGEIRDAATVNAAIQAAQTGHLVLSTVHANDAISTVGRLLDLGADAYALADVLIATIAQRLVRVVCPECHQYIPVEESREFFESEGLEVDVSRTPFYPQSVGCDTCGHSGYKGRVAVMEMLRTNPDIREQVRTRASYRKIQDTAQETGHFQTLYQEGLQKVLQGVTTIEEVRAVCSSI